MSGTYGEPGKNPYPIPGIVGQYSNVVNASTGVSQIYQKSSQFQYTSIGTYNPSTKKFTPDPNASLSTDNIKILSDQSSINAIKGASITTATKAGLDPTKAQQLITPNTAAAAGGAGAAGAGPAGPPESGNVREGTKTDSFGDFVYPEGIRKSKQDVIKFTMLKYKPSGVGATQSAGKSDRGSLTKGIPEGRTILGSVVLPIPNNISDTNSMDWGSNTMNAFEAGLAAAAFTGISGGIGKGIENLGATVNAAGGDENFKKSIGALFAGAAAGVSGNAILSRAEGVVINPNLELLFNGPQLRPFNFTFKLAAREKRESEQIIKILNFFKRGSSAIRTESNLFLRAPHTFRIQYLHMGQNDHPFIGRIKECALQSITTSYTPEGQYATFSDGVMVSYQITMQFSELEPIFNDDYNELTGIGF
jgi:hypothetical protein